MTEMRHEETAPEPPFQGVPPLRASRHGGWDYTLDLPELEKPLDPARLFGRAAPFEIEVGTGSGYFLSRYAMAHPEINLLGVDKARGEVHRASDKLRRHGLFNARVIACDAPYFLDSFIPPASVQTYHIYYSDPWPKKRHHKRRLWSPKFIPVLERTLAPGGRLLMKTDVTAYFEVIDEVLRGAEQLELVEDRRIDIEPLEGDITSNFQEKAIEKGHPLHYQEWRRV